MEDAVLVKAEGTRQKAERALVAGVLAAIVVTLGVGLVAQAPPPSPELKKLEALLGTWNIDGDVQATLVSPAGEFTGTERVEWLPGGRFMELSRDAKGPSGPVRHRLVFGYDVVAKAHTAKWFDLTGGGAGSFTSTAAGSTWNWAGTGFNGDGTAFHERCVWAFSTGGSQTRKCEHSPDGKAWSPSFTGTYTKVK
jgi:hypothetical protein